jgi:type II secretory pathway pseudopilin PulG
MIYGVLLVIIGGLISGLVSASKRSTRLRIQVDQLENELQLALRAVSTERKVKEAYDKIRKESSGSFNADSLNKLRSLEGS